jgi:CrcB protein
MTPLFLVGAALGGALRFLAEYYVPPIGTSGFPRATLIVNVIGSFVLGVVWHAGSDVRIVVGTGVCGALTTFSGVALQVLRRLRAHAVMSAMAYIAATLALGLAAAAVGLWIGAGLYG